MPSPEAHELALLLVGKAEGDESILDKLLDDHDVPDDVLGFHVQQAVEKRLKAVLAFNEVEYEHTHSVSYLTALIEKQGIDLPARPGMRRPRARPLTSAKSSGSTSSSSKTSPRDPGKQAQSASSVC